MGGGGGEEINFYVLAVEASICTILKTRCFSILQNYKKIVNFSKGVFLHEKANNRTLFWNFMASY